MCVGKCVRECEYTCVFVCVLAMCVFVALFLPGIFSAASAMINCLCLCLCRSLRLCHDSRCEFHDKTNVPQAEPSNANDSHTPAAQISEQPSPGNCT